MDRVRGARSYVKRAKHKEPKKTLKLKALAKSVSLILSLILNPRPFYNYHIITPLPW